MCYCGGFPFQSSFVEEMLPTMAQKTMNQHILPSLTSNIVMFTSFDLWMSHNDVNIFALVIKFLMTHGSSCMSLWGYLK
jgi:hypothetical protein